LIFSPYLTPHVGGLESFVSELNEVLLRDHELEQITVFTARLPLTASGLEDQGPRYRIVRYPAVELIPNFPFPKLWTVSFWRALRSASPRGHDLLMSHTRFFVSSAMALACARATRRPLVHVEHGSDYVQLGRRAMRLLARAYDLLLGRLVLRRADAVVTVSEAAASFVRRLARRESHVIYRGIWPHRLSSLSPDRRVLKYAAGRTVVTFVGRLIDGKGVADLVQAYARVDEADSMLCLVGDGPRRPDLELLAHQLGIAERVVFIGYLEESEALAAILASDLIVNPSYTEGLPTSVLEAALLGRAVLATDVGGTPEIIDHERTGVLVAARDIEALTSELGRLISDERLRSRLGAAARADAVARFDWSVSAAQFVELARALVAGSAAAEAIPVDVAPAGEPEGNQLTGVG
jgi:glycosyltransferase involved in cell wall biosynthesis